MPPPEETPCAPAGCVVWESRYDGAAQARDVAHVVAANDALVFVSGQSYGDDNEVQTLALDASTGAVAWASERVRGGAEGIAVSPDGETVFVASWAYHLETLGDVRVAAHDARTGALRWTVGYNDDDWDGTDTPAAMAMSPDGGRLFVVGRTYAGPANGADMLLMAVDAADGSVAWLRTVPAPVEGAEEGVAVGVSPDGATVFATGTSGSPATGGDFLTVAVGAGTGGVLWSSVFASEGAAEDAPRALAVSPDGSRVFVAGATRSGTTSDYATVAYDAATGVEAWRRAYAGPAGGDDVATTVAAGDGAVLVAGSSWTGLATGDVDVVVLAYDAATGATRWSSPYAGPAGARDEPRALALHPDGSEAYVAAASDGRGTGLDYATLGLDLATGALQWASRHEGHGGDSPTALALAPDAATLYVTGASEAGSADYATFALRVRTAPGAPADVAARGGPAGGEVTVEWAPPPNVGARPLHGYVVYRDGARVAELEADARAYVDRGLAHATGYAYRVAAANAYGKGVPSEERDAFTLSPPAAPEGLWASQGDEVGEVVLSWWAPSHEGSGALLGYRIYRGLLLVGEVDSTTRAFVDQGHPPGLASRYSVRAHNFVGEGPAATSCGIPYPWPVWLTPQCAAAVSHGPGQR